MRELIKITEHQGNQAVSARELYEYLEINERFSRWFERMASYSLVEGVDYTPYQNVHPQNNQVIEDFALSMDCAKVISMLQRNEKGNEARRYFIEVEKKAKSLLKPQSTLDILKLTIQGLEEQQKELSEVKQDIKELKARNTTIPEYFTIAGFGSLNGIPVNIKVASMLGREASRICRERGLLTDEIPDPRFGKVKMYPKTVLNEVFNNVQI